MGILRSVLEPSPSEPASASLHDEPEERAGILQWSGSEPEAPDARHAAVRWPLSAWHVALAGCGLLLAAAAAACLIWRGVESSQAATSARRVTHPTRGGQHFHRGVQFGAQPDEEGNASTVAVLLQVVRCSSGAVFREAVAECLGSIASSAGELNWTVSVNVAVSPECHKDFLPTFQSFPLDGEDADLLHASIHEVPGRTSAELLAWQLEAAEASSAAHELALIVGSDAGADVSWRAAQALCGTPAQVHSVQRQFAENETLGLVAPLGTMVTRGTTTEDVLPWLRERRFRGEATCDSAVSDSRLARLDGHLSDKEGAVAVAGGTYWVRWGALPVKRVVELSKAMRLELGSETPDGKDAQKSLLEVYVPTSLRLSSLRLAEMPPAPKPMALYFPQYYPIPENDEFWGEGFTEWTLLRPFEADGIRKPMEADAGGLGYYDLRDESVRARQGDMAREYGVHGFVYYHYWFSSVEGGKVMYRVPELRIKDGQPDVPFMLSWANEAWTRRWDGGADESSNNTLLAQEYGSEDEWAEHFQYLLQFFKHPKYIRVSGKPAFAIYRAGLLEKKLEPMLTLWEGLARDSGLTGLHIIATLGGKFGRGPDELLWTRTPLIEAAFHYVSTNFCCWDEDDLSTWPPAPAENKRPSSTVQNSPEMSQATQYWGATAGFDNRPRHPENKEAFPDWSQLEPWMFGAAVEFSLRSMSQHGGRDVQDNLYFIGSWNEWNEQSVLEPSESLGFGFLEALLHVLRRVPARALGDL